MKQLNRHRHASGKKNTLSPQNRRNQYSLLSDQKGGVALVLVMWVVVVLVAIVGEFAFSMRTEINITRNFKEEEEAYQLALSGIEQAKVEILNIKDMSKMYVDGNNVIIFDPEAEVPERKDSLERGKIEYALADEDGKMNINTATLEQLRSLFAIAGVESTDIDTIVDSILDWRDTDDLHMLNGAEDDYYESLDRPYSCKDGPFDAVEELLLVKGMTPEMFYGTKTGDEETAEKVIDGVGKYFTVHGSGVLNIKTAPRAVIEAVYGVEVADNIIAQREAGQVSGLPVNSKEVSEFFTVKATGSNSDSTIRRTIKAVLQKQEDSLEIIYWNDNSIG